MLYFSGSDGACDFIITDSETGGSFKVHKGKEVFTRDGMKFPVEKVLGYFKEDEIYILSKELVLLLGCVECVELIHHADIYATVSSFDIDECSEYCILLSFGITLRIFDVLDVLLDIRYDANFEKMLKDGTIYARFGETFLKIKFCGDYMGVVAKLLVLRGKNIAVRWADNR